ncbi:10862_t:CDS:2, partial [Acaulospora morrowiae]
TKPNELLDLLHSNHPEISGAPDFQLPGDLEKNDFQHIPIKYVVTLTTSNDAFLDSIGSCDLKNRVAIPITAKIECPNRGNFLEKKPLEEWMNSLLTLEEEFLPLQHKGIFEKRAVPPFLYFFNLFTRAHPYPFFSIWCDSPNLFTETFSTMPPGVNQPFFDRDPDVFEFVSLYLRGYNIFPLTKERLPVGWDMDNFLKYLTLDACFFKLQRLVQIIRPFFFIGLSLPGRDFFSNEEKVMVYIRRVEPSLLHISEDGNVMYRRQGQILKGEFFANHVAMDLHSANHWEFKFLGRSDGIMMSRISERIWPLTNRSASYFLGEPGSSFFDIDDTRMHCRQVYDHSVGRSFRLYKSSTVSCARIWICKLVFSLKKSPDPDKSLIIVPVWGVGVTQLYFEASSITKSIRN